MSDPRVAVLMTLADARRGVSVEQGEALEAGAEALRLLAELRFHHAGGTTIGAAVTIRRVLPEVAARAAALVADVQVEPIDFEARLAAHRREVDQAVSDGDFERN